MSTTGSHGVRAAQRPPSQLPAPSPRWATIIRACAVARMYRYKIRSGFRHLAQVRRPLAVLTNGTVGPNTKCCAGQSRNRLSGLRGGMRGMMKASGLKLAR
jgi:hypothetical protein